MQENLDNQMDKAETQVSGVARRYAEALYDLAEGQKKVKEVEKDIGKIEKTLEESSELKDFVKSPIFSMEDKQNAFKKIMKKIKVTELSAKFIHTIIANRRSMVMNEIIIAFKAKLASMRGETIAQITSAHKLSDKQIGKLQKTLKSVIGKDVILQISNDNSLQGGMIVKIGSKQIDTSIKTKLNSLQLTLKEVG